MIDINGEQLTVAQANDLLRMLYNDAKQVAGEFHNMERSDKFRTNWPDEDVFAESEWKNFVEAVIQMYTAQLADPMVPEADKQRMFKAIVLNQRIAEGQERDTRLQIMPNTQAFVGDKSENRRTMEKFGAAPNYRALLKRTAASFMTKH